MKLTPASAFALLSALSALSSARPTAIPDEAAALQYSGICDGAPSSWSEQQRLACPKLLHHKRQDTASDEDGEDNSDGSDDSFSDTVVKREPSAERKLLDHQYTRRTEVQIPDALQDWKVKRQDVDSDENGQDDSDDSFSDSDPVAKRQDVDSDESGEDDSDDSSSDTVVKRQDVDSDESGEDGSDDSFSDSDPVAKRQDSDSDENGEDDSDDSSSDTIVKRQDVDSDESGEDGSDDSFSDSDNVAKRDPTA